MSLHYTMGAGKHLPEIVIWEDDSIYYSPILYVPCSIHFVITEVQFICTVGANTSVIAWRLSGF